MKESRVRSFVVKALAPLHAVPVENAVWPGHPDVDFVRACMEIKVVPDWPKRSTTIVRVDTFTQDQRFFLEERERAGESTWLLLVVDRDWLLFRGGIAARHVGRTTTAGLLVCASAHWLRRPTPQALLEMVR